MIEQIEKDLVEVGNLLKAHGINGEMNAVLDADLDWNRLDCFFIKVGGIATPFYIAEMRETSNRGVLLRFEDVETPSQLRPLLSARTLYAKRACVLEMLAEAEEYELKGYELQDEQMGALGVIEGVDDSTANVLWRVNRPNCEELLVPAAEDYVVEIDDTSKRILIRLPEGFPL